MKKYFKVSIYITIMFIVLSLSSCKKDSTTESGTSFCNTSTKSGYSMLYFTNKNQADSLLALITEMSETEQIADFEKSRGYISMGRSADEFYESVNFDAFKDQNEFDEFIKANSAYFDVRDSPDGNTDVLPKCFFDKYRYLANTDGILRIGDTLIRLFSTGRVYTLVSNLSQLLSITDLTLNSISINSGLTYEPYPENEYILSSTMNSLTSQCILETDHSECWIPNENARYYNVNGDMKINAKFSTIYNKVFNNIDVVIESYCQHLTLGRFWTICRRHISFEGKLEHHYKPYISGTGPSAYSAEWTDGVESINETRYGFRANISIYYLIYRPNEVGFFHRYDPQWSELVHFKTLLLAVHSASVDMIFVTPITETTVTDSYLYYLLNKYQNL